MIYDKEYNMSYYAGIDLGGTKSAACIAKIRDGTVHILKKLKFPTLADDPDATLLELNRLLYQLLADCGITSGDLKAIGISCGGPLDPAKGLILSPPNLPAWDRVQVCRWFTEEFHVPAFLENDANACALAEWQFGAGIGTSNMAFLTFGTGLGAGLILGGRLYGGSCGLAGEIGHIRAEHTGPAGYGKAGSYEGFCSGGGMMRFAKEAIESHLFTESPELLLSSPDGISAKEICRLAGQEDPFCLRIIHTCATQLGRCLAMLIDLLNPDAIVIGSIYQRNVDLFWPTVMQIIQQEALPAAAARCRILPSALGDEIGDYAAVTVGYMGLHQTN